jgi:hypothetical protein
MSFPPRESLARVMAQHEFLDRWRPGASAARRQAPSGQSSGQPAGSAPGYDLLEVASLLEHLCQTFQRLQLVGRFVTQQATQLLGIDRLKIGRVVG